MSGGGRCRLPSSQTKTLGMVAQSGDLVGEEAEAIALVSGVQCFQRSHACAADPPRHNQEAELVGLVEEFVAIGFPFQSNGVRVPCA